MADMLDATPTDLDRVEHPHILWIGCGDMCKRSLRALTDLQSNFGARLTLVDIRDEVRQPPPPGADFFNVAIETRQKELHDSLIKEPATHIFVANWPDQHLLTALLFGGKCPLAQIVVAKPLDTNIRLIESLAASSPISPGLPERIFEHDHYRNKGAVEPVYHAFPKLIDSYGRLTQFEFYLVEYESVEDRDRTEALREGVIFDLSTHLFALCDLFLLSPPHPALNEQGLVVKSVDLSINKVARARYTRCHIENSEAETFAAIDVTLTASYARPKSGRVVTFLIPGLIVVGKGIKPTSNVTADLKGLRFTLELQARSLNLSRNEVSPPLSDIQFDSAEDGFHTSLVDALSRQSPRERSGSVAIPPVVPLARAARIARLLGEVSQKASRLEHYRIGDTLDSVLARCVAAGTLDAKWLSKSGYADIGFAPARDARNAQVHV